mmetsp:Transcript_8769/g.10841  ORF Transcript_8769/g.10841 Transcript_8769/m.10841 type:complete len:111 (+) Transcript_8769:1650-1982(+)
MWQFRVKYRASGFLYCDDWNSAECYGYICCRIMCEGAEVANILMLEAHDSCDLRLGVSPGGFDMCSDGDSRETHILCHHVYLDTLGNRRSSNNASHPFHHLWGHQTSKKE